MQNHSTRQRLVVLVYSTGGLNHLRSVLSSLVDHSANTAFIVAHYGEKNQAKQLKDILELGLNRPVIRAKDGLPIVNNNLYLTPLGAQFCVLNQTFKVTAAESAPNTSNLDIFLDSIGISYGQDAMVIVLPGKQTDGIAGCISTHCQGGRVLCIEPSVTYPSDLPKAIASSGCIDQVGSLYELSSTCVQWLQGSWEPEPTSIDPQDLEKLHQFFRDKMDCELALYADDFVAKNLQRRLYATDKRTVSAYLSSLDAVEGEAFVNQLHYQTAEFFPDQQDYEFLGAKVFPLTLNLGSNEQLRAWVCDVGTGQEAYSVAIALAEMAEASSRLFDFKIFATGANPETIAEARAGMYPLAAIQSVPSRLRTKYFTEASSGFWQVTKSLREHMVFARLDLLQDIGITKNHLVVCRGLISVLSDQGRRLVMPKVGRALLARGFMMHGPTETLTSEILSDSGFSLHDGSFKRRIAAPKTEVKSSNSPGTGYGQRTQRYLEQEVTNSSHLARRINSLQQPKQQQQSNQRIKELEQDRNDLQTQLEAAYNNNEQLQTLNQELLLEQSLLQQQLGYTKTSFEFSTQGICVVSKDLKVLQANPQALTLLNSGQPIEIGQPIKKLVPSDSKLTRSVVDAVRQGVAVVETETLNNCSMQLRAVPVGPTDDPEFVILYIDEQDQQQLELFQLSAKKGIGLLRVNRSGTVLRSNGAMENLLDWQDTRAEGAAFDKLFEEEYQPNVLKLVNRTQNDIHESVDACLRGNNLNQKWVRLIAQHFRHGALIFVLDITEEKQLTVQLQQAHKMEAIGKLTSGIAHDFNNILTALMGNLELMKLKDSRLPQTHLTGYLDQAMSSAERARKLIAQMLMFSHRGNGQHNVEHINPIVAGVLEMLKTLFNPSIRVYYAEQGAAFANIDKVQLEQIIMNLCINSRDALASGGEIAVSVSNHQASGHKCASCHQEFAGDYVRLSVADTGPGIVSEQLARIFDPFFTTKEVGEGTGMGLSVVHGLVHEQQGHLEVGSPPGEGASFTVYLPAAQPNEQVGYDLAQEQPRLSVASKD